ncbi:MAG TPA: VWA domain-containing protein [Polyangiaceae bacterium]|nr:VWA domain-containing protein [Polyangiaceae bacterium]
MSTALLAFVFTGLGGGALLGWFVALGLPIVGLYLLRVRRRRVAVPFLALLREWPGASRRTALERSLRHVLSLLVQLALLLLLLLALADPRPEGQARPSRSLALLVDVSASMATTQAGQSRFERARLRANELIGSLGAGDELLVIQLGAHPRALGGFSRDRARLRDAIAGLDVLDTSADLSAGLRLADDALRGRERGEIVLLSDGAFPAHGLGEAPRHPLRYDPLDAGPGPQARPTVPSPPAPPAESPTSSTASAPTEPPAAPLDNLGLVAFSARRYPRDPLAFEVLAVVHNAAAEPREIELTIAAAAPGAADVPLELVRLRLAPGETQRHVRANLTGADERLRASIRRLDGREDGLSRDDSAFAVLPPPRSARVLVVGEPNTFLDAALLAEPGVRATRVSAAAYPPAGEFDVTIFDGAFPARVAATGPALYLGTPPDPTAPQSPTSPPDQAGSRYPVGVGKALTDFGFDHWLREDPLFRFLDPYDVQVLRGRELSPSAADRVLGRSDQGAILVAGERSEGRFLALGFDPRDSDFVLRIAFPVFVTNALDRLLAARADGRALDSSHLIAGVGAALSVPGLAQGWAEIVGPEGPGALRLRVPVVEHSLVFAPERAGFYRLESAGSARTLAASLVDVDESSVAPRRKLELSGQSVRPLEALEPLEPTTPWTWLVAVAWLIALIEWLSYHRRWTV